MYYTTGFTHDELIDICVRITSVGRELDAAKWPKRSRKVKVIVGRPAARIFGR